MPDTLDNSKNRDKVSKLFEFVRAFTASRHPIKRRLDEQPFPNLQLKFDALPQSSEWVEPWSGDEDAREWLLRVTLRAPPPCPQPPTLISDWLLPGWERHDQEARYAPEKSLRAIDGTTRIEHFDKKPNRLQAWELWTAVRKEWAQIEQRHDPVRNLFATLQILRAELQREAERVELVLGVAMLDYQSNVHLYSHPLILKPLGLEFDADENVFVLSETDRPTELYSEPLAELETDLTPTSDWRERLKRLHPLDEETKTFIKSIGDWIRGKDKFASATVKLAPVIFLRDRGGWAMRAADAVLQDLAGTPTGDVPVYLRRLAGAASTESTEESNTAEEDQLQLPNEDGDILFALPANMEQLALARQLERKDAVLVQGPPGTGKTHTIANLLGHLLAQGKRVLVTSHTSKALRVLRDKVPEDIRSLCVSVIDSPARSRRELDEAVRAIAEKMQAGHSSLRGGAERSTTERKRLIEEIRNLRQQQRACVKAEYDDIVIGAESFSPTDAARFLREGIGKHDWIPGPLASEERGKVCPLTIPEIETLYRSQQQITEPIEAELRAGLPTEGWLPAVADWVTQVRRVHELGTQVQNIATPIWAQCSASAEILRTALNHAEHTIQEIQKIETAGVWLLDLVEAGFDQGANTAWRDLKSLTNDTVRLAATAQSALIEYAPELSPDFHTEEILIELQAIHAHVERGRGLTIFSKGIWRKLAKSASCNSRNPKSANEWHALSLWLELHLQRGKLLRRWQRQVETLGAPTLPDTKPETQAAQWLSYIESALQWRTQNWQTLPAKLDPLGKPWASIEPLVPPQSGAKSRLNRARRLLESHLLPELRTWLAQRERETIRHRITEWRKKLRSEIPNIRPNSAVARIDAALSQWDVDGYNDAMLALQKLRDLLPVHQKRDGLLAKLDNGATAWGAALKQRTEYHNAPLPAGQDVTLAWRWRQFNDELNHRHQLNAEEIAKKLEAKNRDLERVTGKLIAESAWAKQLSAAERFRQHLVGWLDIMRRIGKGTGANAERYRIQARNQLKNGQHAVPVWIMPMAQVFQSFTAADANFDVVIVDEASQAGLEGLLAAYLGKKLVVVGDHEQVSPDAVGQEAGIARNLQAQFLQGIPNAPLYDGKLSLYDLTRQSTSGMLSLSEHFRCVPSIIGFSNRLSYDGRIKPLREPSSSILRSVIPYRVNGRREGRSKINQIEAQEIVALIAAMCRHDAYEGQSIGVISLLGEEQAQLIERMLREHLSVDEIEARKIICGNAAQFQGDERGVMLLSMVDSNEGDGPMRKQGEGADEMYKKRYNVAASRAQNQMWIVHSLSYETDLKIEDLRRELLDYAHVATQQNENDGADDGKYDSEFERLIAKELKSRGFRVRAQYRVGFYRIDLVVEGNNGKRLAIECDGDRWHSGSEKIAEDLARQAVLERLGWTFHRIRGSEFFREPENSINRLLSRLNNLGIQAEEVNKTTTKEQKRADVIHEEIMRLAQEIRTEFFGN